MNPMAPVSPTSNQSPAILRSGAMTTPAQAQSTFLDQHATNGRSPTPAQLLKAMEPSFSTLLSEQVRATVDVESVWRYAQMRRNNLYYRGKQNLTLTATSSGNGMVDYRPVSGSTNMGIADRSSESAYDIVLNWFRGDVRAFNAVLGARSPNVQALARDTADETLSRRVRKANRVAQYLRSHCDFDNFHRELVYSLALNGTTYSHSRYVANAAKFGYTSIPRYEWTQVPGGENYFQCYGCGSETPASTAQGLATQDLPLPRCMTCGRPQDPSTLISPDPIPALTIKTPLQFPNGAVELSLENASTVTIPFWVKDSLSNTPWLLKETEEDKGAMCQAHPDLRESLINNVLPSPSSQQETMARYTRDLFASPTGYVIARKSERVTHSQVWYSSWVYEYIPGDRSGYFRELLYKMCPDGMRVQYANQKPFRLSNERLTKNWAACKPEPGETLVGDPYFEDYITASDTINDFLNILIESGQRSIPLIVFDPDVLQPQRIKDYANLPGEFLPARASATSDLSKAFFKAPAAEISPVLIEFIEKYMSWVRDISGITPQIWGGGGPEPTARAAELKRNQALLRLNTVWNYIRDFESATYENLAFQLARFSDGRLFTSKGTPDTLDIIEIDDIQEINKGGWKYWSEEALPMTPGQRRDWYMNLFQMAASNPGAAKLSGLDDPANLARWQETVGSADWRTPGLMEREGIMALLAVVSTLPPTPGGMAPGPTDPMTGQPLGPPTPLPPIPNTPYPMEEISLVYPPDLLLQVTREFMNGDKGSEIRETSYQTGWQNLMAFLKTLLQGQPPPPPPEMKVNLNLAGKLTDFGPPTEASILTTAGLPPAGPIPDLSAPPAPSPNDGGGPPPEGGPDGPPSPNKPPGGNGGSGGGMSSAPHHTGGRPKSPPPSPPSSSQAGMTAPPPGGIPIPPPGLAGPPPNPGPGPNGPGGLTPPPR